MGINSGGDDDILLCSPLDLFGRIRFKVLSFPQQFPVLGLVAGQMVLLVLGFLGFFQFFGSSDGVVV